MHFPAFPRQPRSRNLPSLSLVRPATALDPRPAFLSFLASVLLAGTIAASVPAGAQTMMQRQYNARDKPAGNPSAGCGDFNYHSGSVGPLDYRSTPQDVRDFIESRHFTQDVERLIRGKFGTLPGDIAYTLSAFPNHPRALKSAAALMRRTGGQVPPGFRYRLACWFDRAIAFRPDDVQVRILWAFELIQMKDNKAALEQTRAAEALAGENPAAQYNVGLLYFDLGDHERAMANARLAYAGGFNLPGLKNKLIRAGQWKE